MSEPPRTLLELRNLSKSFGDVRVLSGINLDIRAGEIHALIGQNGSGKSTLIKLLSGYHAPDEGKIVVRGQPVLLPMKPGESAALGLRFLHQDVGLAGTMTVLENLRVGRYAVTRFGRLRWNDERAATRRLLADMDLDIDPDLRVRDVPPAQRALIGFARAIAEMDHGRGDILILDEPTAFLPAPSVEKLFRIIRGIAGRGSAIIFVSHRLDEIMGLADRVSVLRDGRLVQTDSTANSTERQLVTLMLGRELDVLYPTRTPAKGSEVFAARAVSGAIALDVSFAIHDSEIVGITGLLGMGHDEIPYLLFGAQKMAAGDVVVGTTPMTRPTPQWAIAEGLAFLPADRQRQSGIPSATLLENVSMTQGARFFRRGRLGHAAERTAVQAVLDRFDVRPPDPDRLLATLSGGNQQKALLGKWLQRRPAVLMLHEPTQGVDIGSRREILRIIQEVASAGTAVLIASAEYDELAHLCHRVLIFRHGRICRELTGSDLTEARIAEQCYLS